jgi:RNA polymerase sigma-70 factor (ECF subfamily)
MECDRSPAVEGDDTRNPSRTSLFSTAGLDALYRSSAARLVRQLARRVDCEEADDVVQETFAKLAGANTHASAPIACPEAFVTTAATNVLRDRARAAARRALQDYNLACGPDAAAPDPQRLAESREALRAIDGALAGMNPRRRQIFLLHRFEQLTYAEVGEVVGMSEKGVKKQIAKALVELRRAAGAAE